MRLQQANSWVNLIYGAYYKYNDPKRLLRLFIWSFRQRPTEIDTINFSGPRFADVDNRLMSLQLVKTEWLTRLCLILKDETYFRQQYYIKEYSCSKRQFSSVTKK
jgi:hypothetical protein